MERWKRWKSDVEIKDVVRELNILFVEMSVCIFEVGGTTDVVVHNFRNWGSNDS